ncbi:MAG: hypothetical protein JWO30_4725 [Fibrobacteres bacterium]|nr:hypothetical protein [Fibrobacterota bacterium]
MKSILINTACVLVLTGVALAQVPAPTKVPANVACPTGPKMNGSAPDTVVAAPDAEGFVSIFNGKDLTGWWKDCQTGHTSAGTNGALWFADSVQHLLYSSEDNKSGGIVVTNKIYDNYEIILDVWPTFGNDGGVFNRTTARGSCWQSTIDYIAGSSVGGSFNENGWTSGNLNDDPYLFGGAASSVTIKTWTTFTAGLTPGPTTYGCTAGGCVATDFPKIWDVNGWNTMRVKFYGGLTAGTSVTMETFTRKANTLPWVPLYGKTLPQVTPAGPIGLQVHGGGRWNQGTWSAYKRIKVRPLKADGTPITGPLVPVESEDPTSVEQSRMTFAKPKLTLSNGVLSGTLGAAYDVSVTDVRGHVLERFHSDSGNLNHTLTTPATGVLVVELKGHLGTEHIRFSRI